MVQCVNRILLLMSKTKGCPIVKQEILQYSVILKIAILIIKCWLLYTVLLNMIQIISIICFNAKTEKYSVFQLFKIDRFSKSLWLSSWYLNILLESGRESLILTESSIDPDLQIPWSWETLLDPGASSLTLVPGTDPLILG